ncbi:hypothetical protein [Acinetobacter lwoffii]|uniref:Uroporphyrinogen-III C-methyltransferase n=1 Tax=Acinetobacter lwoffii NIPH 478 TaxID=1217668 RepID=N9HIQ1_ACILW|nr:hypothetical protein [Acinetobacter lwoffii]ENW29069.1 hypothetical protein F923_02351 [Acinetobacter lwoffii NIPH 478]
MKKLFIVLFILSLSWLVKLSYDLHILNKAQTEFNQSINQLQQQNANLNDQFVALKRQIFAQQENAGTTPSKASVGEAVTNETQNDIALIQQHLDLIEFALKQQQYATAIEKLNQLSNELDDYILAPALVSSLQQVIAKDQDMLKKFVNSRLVQQNKVKELLVQMDAEIEKEIQTPYRQRPETQRSFWQRWVQIESADQPSTVLMQRHLVLKEAQLRLLIAQNTLQKDQSVAFQQALNAVIEVLEQLPDAQSQKWIQQLNQIKATPITPIPLLNTRTLVG